MATIKIGSVTFQDPLHWLTKDDPVVVASRTRTLTGAEVTSSLESPSQTAIHVRCTFRWTSLANVAILKGYWRSQQLYSANLEGSGSDYYVRFNPENGVTNVVHEGWGDDVPRTALSGKPTDKWKGELNLIIET